MVPMSTAVWSHERNVRSLAKNVLGSMRMGTVRSAPPEPEGSWSPPRNRLARLKNFAEADAADRKDRDTRRRPAGSPRARAGP